MIEKCDICGSTDIREYTNLVGTFCKCRKCGIVWEKEKRCPT